MSDPVEVKIYIVMNEDGDYEAHSELETAVSNLADNSGGEIIRTVCITTTMSPPTMVEVQAPAIPDEVGTTGPVEAA
jgi:hypothetical protein